jgi:hypothetical protein
VRLFEIYLMYIMVWCHLQTFGQKTSPSISKLDLSPKWLGSEKFVLRKWNSFIFCTFTYKQKMSQRIRKFYLPSMYENVVRDF